MDSAVPGNRAVPTRMDAREDARLKEMVRPFIAFLMGALAAAIAGSAVVACSYVTAANVSAHMSGLIGIFIFGVIFAITVTVPRSVVLWLFLFVPCWLFRLRIAAFWRWGIAPVVGGVLNLVIAELWNRMTPLDADPQRLKGLMLGYYVGAAAGGVCMFAIGCIRRRRTTGEFKPGVSNVVGRRNP